MAMAGECPYFKKEMPHGEIVCECARLKFPDRVARREMVYRFCAHPDGFRECTLKQSRDRYYDRLYGEEGGEK